MGCRQSKSASAVLNAKKKDLKEGKDATTTSPNGSMKQTASSPSTNTNPPRPRSSDRVYKLLLKSPNGMDDNKAVLQAVTPSAAAYRNPVTAASPLHLAVQLLDSHLATMTTNATTESSSLVQVISELIRAYPEAVYTPDAAGYIPLHYAIAPCSESAGVPPSKGKPGRVPHVTAPLPPSTWRWRAAVVRLLLAADTTSASYDYLARNDVSYNDAEMGGYSPLYRVVQCIPDDDTPQQAPTLEYLHVVLKYMVHQAARAKEQTKEEEKEPMVGTPLVGMGNHSDGDKPLALLYRRFTRQFDLAEKFFDGDNSRTEVVEHRRKYKTSAGNTWKMMELLLKQQEQLALPVGTPVKITHRTVHRAVQGETPPDLLRYIVETNAEDLTLPDEAGNLPLHYAARYRPKDLLSLSSKGEKGGLTKAVFPAFYSKYVMDELLYKYPEAALRKDAAGNYPLLLAVQSGKQWIGGGTKSLYDAYPEALQQIQLSEYPSLQRALMALDDVDETKEEKVPQRDIIRDEQYDAIMLVQGENVDVSEVVTSMWAHEEDPGVQMLGCVAIRRLLRSPNGEEGDAEHCLRIALSAVPAVVNAMKAHPNEVIVQEKACHTLRAMASADGKREVSFVASGAVAAVVGAMQAHVSDAGVQEEALGALGRILQFGGADRATVVASVSGLTAMLNAMAAHPMVRGVQREGCRALRELTNYAATANLPELPQSQTETLLEHAKTNFPEDCTEHVDILLTRLS